MNSQNLNEDLTGFEVHFNDDFFSDEEYDN